VRGEVVHHPSGLEFEVLEADRRRVKTLKVRSPDGGAPRTASA
jgi:magnesium and cobalt transporter